MSALLELAKRCEAATAEQQDDLLREAWKLVHPKPDNPEGTGWYSGWHDFERKLAAGAFVDAALTLVPEGLCLTVQERNVNDDHNWRYFASLWNPTTDVEARGKAKRGKLPLAICAAALRARGMEQAK